MSYSFRIYLSESPATGTLAEAVSSISGLKIAAGTNLSAMPMFIPVERKGAYAFTIDGPQDEYAEDVPQDVTASILGVKQSFEVSVEGSQPGMIPEAWKFAKKLAKITGGVAVDLQTNERWPTTSTRKFVKPTKGSKIDIVAIYWYYVPDEAPGDLPVRILDLARKYLPEALPRKFTQGTNMSGDYEKDNLAFLVSFADKPMWGVRELCTPPVFSLSIDGLEQYKETDIRTISMDVDRAALYDERWRDALRRFFIEVARASGSFFASAEVARGYFWGGRELQSEPSTTEGAFTCLWAGEWRGLRRWPQWWTWFAGPYKELVQAHLIGQTIEAGDGVFHALSEEPLDRDALGGLVSTPGSTWIPEHLTFTNDYLMSPPSATTIPPRLLEVRQQAP